MPYRAKGKIYSGFEMARGSLYAGEFGNDHNKADKMIDVNTFSRYVYTAATFPILCYLYMHLSIVTSINVCLSCVLAGTAWWWLLITLGKVTENPPASVRTFLLQQAPLKTTTSASSPLH